MDGGFSDPGKILLPDKLAAPLALANRHEECLQVCGRLGAGAGGVSAAAQDVVDRADQEALGMRQGLKDGPAALLEDAQQWKNRAMCDFR